MKKYQNVGTIDRFIRGVCALCALLGAFFWTYGICQVVLYVAGGILLITALGGVCALYTIFNWSSLSVEAKEVSITMNVTLMLLFLVLGCVGSYYSNFFTKKFFIEDYNQMNQYYKQTLFFTGQNNREQAILNYDQLVANYTTFREKYTQYRPYAFSGDTHFSEDVQTGAQMIIDQKDKIYSGDLTAAHRALEEVRPIYQDILKRNEFSLLAVHLVDFHDAMEKIIEQADLHNSEGVLAVYQDVNEKLKAVEDEAHDAEIQSIRRKLEELVLLANEGKGDALPAKASELKGAFVKVYLKRG